MAGGETWAPVQQQSYALALSARLDAEAVEFDRERPFAESAEHYYLEGMKHYRRGHLGKALAGLARAEEIYPGDERLRRVVERCRENHERARRAARLAEAGEGIEALLEKGRVAEAREVFEEIRADYPDAAEAREWQGRIAAAEESEAQEEARQKLGRARELLEKKNHRRALALIEEALATGAGEERLRGQLAELRKECAELAAKQDKVRGEKAGRELLEKTEGRLARGDHEGAEDALGELAKLGVLEEEAAALRGQLAEARRERSEEDRAKAEEHYRAGLMYYQLGKQDEARREWRRTLEIDPGHKKARKNLARLENE